jgi:hypothetical protein
MPEKSNARPYELPLAALIDASEWTEAAGKRAKLHSTQERALKALKARRKELDGIYERAVAPDTGWQEITKVASMVRE